MAMASSALEKSEFNPQSVIGKKVRFEILLETEEKIPDGIITRIVPTDPTHRHVHYLIQLDSEMTFQPYRRMFRRRPDVTIKHAVLAMRLIGELNEELHGRVRSELSAPMLYYSTKEGILLENELGTKGDLDAIGPVRVHLIE